MASIDTFESRDHRIERMQRDNPARSIELCTVVVDRIWNQKRVLIESKIPERFVDASLGDLGYLAKPVLDAVEDVFLPPAKNDIVGIVFCGPAGSGKSHAAYAIVRAIAERNPEMVAFMTDYLQAFDALKAEFVSGAQNEMSSIWDKLNNISGVYKGLLVLDDVSAKKMTDFEADKMLMIIERRVNEYMPFLLTTNVKPEDFKEIFGSRLASRLLGYCKIVEFESFDRRAAVVSKDYENNKKL